MKSFIEVQFPVSKISKESYKERKAGSNQTLTGLGKWWGRKPLVLVRAVILGLLLPSSSDKKKDLEVFLKLMSMDKDGLVYRKNKPISTKEIFSILTNKEKEEYFEKVDNDFVEKYKKGLSKEQKDNLQLLAFNKLSYDDKLTYCLRPEEVSVTSKDTWEFINGHLKTNASSLQELISELGKGTFGRTPVIGDCFAGGGSIPFEAGRIGADVFASDLNPLASLLNWGNLNILNKNDDEILELKKFQEKVFDAVAQQVDEWGIENNELGMKAKYYLYCNEAICPECGCKVPLAPNWIVSASFKTIAILHYNKENHAFDIEIKSNASKEEIKEVSKNSTIKNGNLACPHCNNSTPISSVRKDKKNGSGVIEYGLRKWEKEDYIPRKDDTFQERLYCIKYIEKFDHKTWEDILKKPAPATDACYGTIHYVSPSKEDLEREEKVNVLLKERFVEWQEKGYIPDMGIEEGYNTDQLSRERGWSYWHQLFNSRQLLLHGLFMEILQQIAKTPEEKSLGILGMNIIVNSSSKLSIWHYTYDKGERTFSNQALNTIYNFAVRGLASTYTSWVFNINNTSFDSAALIVPQDARKIDYNCDIWITDPPYADAVNYHELSEFFLAWDRKFIKKIFPDWYIDSKRALAVKGKGKSFNESMVEVYSNLVKNMPDNGAQVVMFTHQDVSVWADLTYILWSSGLCVTAAWNISTETESGGLKGGSNYVKGTVILVLRKQTSNATAYSDELYFEIEDKVKEQIDSMRSLDDKEDPNFTDTDYLLAAYAASLEVLTSYRKLEGIDLEYELSRERKQGETTQVEVLIQEAVKIAYNYLIPKDFDKANWKELSNEEKLYIKGLESEKSGLYAVSAYQELARGFGVKEYKDLMENTKANQARLLTASEFKNKGYKQTNNDFSKSLLREVLMAIYVGQKEENSQYGKNWLKSEIPDYWNKRNLIIHILDYLLLIENYSNMSHWDNDINEMKILRELVKHDGV